jgi:putative Holliday junction resolvase
MGRILALDYGARRTGIAVTDPLQIIASGLTTVDTNDLIAFLQKYIKAEEVERIIIGMPVNWDESDTHATPLVEEFIKKLKRSFPMMPVETVDERFTSKMAKDAMLDMGLSKKARRDKKTVDQIAATIMLQEYMSSLR